MAADGSIIIDSRINNKGAEADLKALQAKAKSTAQQISALDKELNAATGKRSKLAADMDSARAAAKQTAAALEKVNSQLNAARGATLKQVRQEYPRFSDAAVQDIAASRFRGDNAARLAEQARLTAELEKQDATIAAAAKAYAAQDAAVQRLTARHEGLQARLQQETKLATQQAGLVQYLAANNSMQAYFAKQESAIDKTFAAAEKRQTKLTGNQTDPVRHAEAVVQATQREIAAQEKAAKAAENRAAREEAAAERSAAVNAQARSMGLLQSAGGMMQRAFASLATFGRRAFGVLESGIGRVRVRLDAASKGVRLFANRLAGIVSGALVFNLISAGLRNLTNYMGTALTASSALRTALGNLSGAAQTAAAPIIQVLTPALAALANAAATVFSYIARLVSFLTGKSVSASAAAAAGIAGVGSAASGTAKQVKEAQRSLAGFDELERLNAPEDTGGGGGGGGGGGAGGIVPNYGFEGYSPFLESILDAIKAGDWYKVGELIAEKLNESMAAINWPSIDQKAIQWATNLYTGLNGFVQNLDWGLLGRTIGNGLNVALHFIDTFFQGFDWVGLGAGLGTGLNNLFATVDWGALGRVLSDKLMALLNMLHGFLQEFDWAALGYDVATMIAAALANIDWVQAAGDLGALAIGILTAINTALAQADWEVIGNTILQMLASVDWVGLFQQLGQLLANTWPVVLAAVLLPGIASFVTMVLIPAALTALGDLIAGIVAAIGGWPAVLIAALMVALAVIGGAVAKWLYEHLDGLIEACRNIETTLGNLYYTVIEPIIQHLIQLLQQLWNEHLQQLWNDVTMMLGALGLAVLDLWNNVLSPLINWLISTFGPLFADVFNAAAGLVETAVGFMSDALDLVVVGLRGVLDFLSAVFRGDWDAAWNAIASTVTTVWSRIQETVRSAANGILRFINSMIRAIVNALNSLSFTVPSWVPGIGGNSLGFNLTAPQIPYLAQGAVIPPNREFMAVLGDQSHGTNVEAPLATIQQAVANVLENQLAGQMAGFEAVVAELRDVRQAIYDTELTDSRVGRAAQRWQLRQSIVKGGG